MKEPKKIRTLNGVVILEDNAPEFIQAITIQSKFPMSFRLFAQLIDDNLEKITRMESSSPEVKIEYALQPYEKEIMTKEQRKKAGIVW